MRTLPAVLVATAVLFAGARATAAEKPSDAGESKAELALKQRSAAPKETEIDAAATLASLLDRQAKDAWSNTKAAKVEGVIVQVEKEADGDLHVVLAPRGQEHDTHRWLIAEVPAAAQHKHTDLSLEALRKLQGKPVHVTGWLYYEPDQEQVDPRGTLWELHPVTSVAPAKD